MVPEEHEPEVSLMLISLTTESDILGPVARTVHSAASYTHLRRDVKRRGRPGQDTRVQVQLTESGTEIAVSPGPDHYCTATGAKLLIIMPALSGHYCWTHGGLKLA